MILSSVITRGLIIKTKSTFQKKSWQLTFLRVVAAHIAQYSAAWGPACPWQQCQESKSSQLTDAFTVLCFIQKRTVLVAHCEACLIKSSFQTMDFWETFGKTKLQGAQVVALPLQWFLSVAGVEGEGESFSLAQAASHPWSWVSIWEKSLHDYVRWHLQPLHFFKLMYVVQ